MGIDRRLPTGLASGLAFGLASASAATGEPIHPSTRVFGVDSIPTASISELGLLVVGVCTVIFVIVAMLIGFVSIRYRYRPEDGDREPAQIYGSIPLELAWTVVPIITVFILSLATVRTILALQIEERPEGFLPVTVIGHQWWWEFQYPEHGFKTANELHLPADRGSFLSLESEDVIHSFWIPSLAGKTDVIPNRANKMWVYPEEPGLYIGQCAEYCGTQHAKMLLRVYVHEPAEYERWAAHQRSDAIARAEVAAGRDVFLSTACINCHTVRGTIANGRFGPDLTHLMSRKTLGAGSAPNDAENLRSWLHDPATLKPGVRMPAMGLDEPAANHLVQYLLSLE
jgi:cytochrome c oxidase subunit 2